MKPLFLSLLLTLPALATDARFSWTYDNPTQPATPENTATRFEVWYSLDEPGAAVTKVVVPDATARQVIIKDFASGKNYRANLYAANDIATSAPSGTLTFHVEDPPPTPKAFKVEIQVSADSKMWKTIAEVAIPEPASYVRTNITP
jgi:hypothetical protein